MAEQCKESVFATAAEAIGSLATPKVKVYRPYATYKGKLKLGNDEKYPETTMSIDIVRYSKVKAATAPTASSFVSGSKGDRSGSQPAVEDGIEMPEASTGSTLDQVRNMRRYQINDLEAPNGKRDVPQEELSKGYEYGRTVVVINESERNLTEYETKEGFEIIGFIPMDTVRRITY